jgi:hypothetical protein
LDRTRHSQDTSNLKPGVVDAATSDAGETPFPGYMDDAFGRDAQRAICVSETLLFTSLAQPPTPGEPKQQRALKLRHPSRKI